MALVGVGVAAADGGLVQRLLGLTGLQQRVPLVYANPAVLAFLGFTSLARLRSRSTVSIMDEYSVVDEYGRG